MQQVDDRLAGLADEGVETLLDFLRAGCRLLRPLVAQFRDVGETLVLLALRLVGFRLVRTGLGGLGLARRWRRHEQIGRHAGALGPGSLRVRDDGRGGRRV